jgi:hypothetical protein
MVVQVCREVSAEGDRRSGIFIITVIALCFMML